jgi:hypothetical protein
MKKTIPLIPILLSLLECTPAARTNTHTTMSGRRWTKENLTWADFKQPPPVGENYAAATQSYLTHSYVFVSPDTFRFFIAAWFIPERSWAKKEVNGNAYNLKHEQYHFNLTELYARKLRRRLSVSLFSPTNYQAQITTLFDQYTDKLRVAQAQYDAESNHSLDKEGQEKWIHSIDTELGHLSAYADPSVIVKLQSDMR